MQQLNGIEVLLINNGRLFCLKFLTMTESRD